MADNSNDLPRFLSAKYKSDFAYPTVKDRMPVIITKVIDALYRMKTTVLEEHGEEGVNDLKFIVGELSRLKNHMQTNKPLADIPTDGVGDEQMWNSCLHSDREVQKQSNDITAWFCSSWLLVECFFYRSIISAIRQSNRLKMFDPFGAQKIEAFVQSNAAMLPLLSRLEAMKSAAIDISSSVKVFSEFLQVALWGNKCDLSISAGAANHQTDVDPVGQAVRLLPNILRDDTEAVWNHLINNRQIGRVDIILDNAGFELFTDLCLADVLISTGLATTVHFHGKLIPWFVSDVTADDWQWTLNEMLSDTSSAVMKKFGQLCQQRMADGSWTFEVHPFWTLPYDFAQMESVAPDLHRNLSNADLLIFKGDLNYRKLTGDRLWLPTTPFAHALRGFGPAPLCTLRTLKCDLITGLRPGQAEILASQSSDWMLTGSYAVVQFVSFGKREG